LIETNGLLFGSIGTSTMIAIDVLESDFATAQKCSKNAPRTHRQLTQTVETVEKVGESSAESSGSIK